MRAEVRLNTVGHALLSDKDMAQVMRIVHLFERDPDNTVYRDIKEVYPDKEG